MSSLYVNASPNIIMLGADDQSKRAVSLGESINPQHLGKFFIYAEKGPKQDQIVQLAELKRMYGEKTLDALSKYFNHQTFFARGAISTSSGIMVKRIVPDDAGVRSNVALYMDVIETEVNNYLRDKSGNILLDEKGNKRINPDKPKVKGWKIKFITDSNKEEEPTQEGLLEPKKGTMLRRDVSYVDSETETEVVLVDSDTEFEEKTVIVPGEFENVEEDHPTKTEIILVDSDTEFDITYEDSATEFETIMVPTGTYEEKQVRDETLDEWRDEETKLVSSIGENDRVKSITFKPSVDLISRYRDSLVTSGLKNISVKKSRGVRTLDTGVAILYTFKQLQKLHPNKFRIAEILSDFNNKTGTILEYFEDYSKPNTKYGNSILIPNLRIKDKNSGVVKYCHNTTLLNAKHYELNIVGGKAQWVEKVDGFIISTTTDFNDPNCPYVIEYIAINESHLNHIDAGSTSGYKIDLSYSLSTAINLATPGVSYVIGKPLIGSFKCLEDLSKVPNPHNTINIRFKYQQFGITSYLYCNSNDLTKFYVLELDPSSTIYSYKEFGGLEDIDITIPTKESLENYETASELFNVESPDKIEAHFILRYERQTTVYKGTGNDAGKIFTKEITGVTQAATSIYLDISKVNWNDVDNWIGMDDYVTITLPESKYLPNDFVKEICEKEISFGFQKCTLSKLVPGYKTISVEIEEPKKVPVKVEIKTPKKVEKEVPVKVMVQKPKTQIIMVPKKVEKTVPKKIEVVNYTPSTMYPILEIRAKNQGEYYNNIGFSINTSFGEKYNSILAKKIGWYPLGLQLWERKSVKHTPLIKKTMGNELDAEMIFTEDQLKNPLSDTRVDLSYVFNNSWYNETSRLLPYEPFDYEYFKVYDKNVKNLLKGFLETEKECISFVPETFRDGMAANIEWYDFTGSNVEEIMDQFGLLNPFTCRTSKNIRLQTVTISEERPILEGNLKEVNIGSSKPIFLEGGSDGTMNDENYEMLVQRELDEYIDPNSEMQDLPYSKESTIYDSGFDLETKKKFTNFISLRKDTYVVMSTHMAKLGTKFFNVSQSRSIAAALNTELKLAPESTYYGTPACRGIIVMGAGLLEDGTSDLRIPASYEVMVKICKLAGAGDGKWDMTNLFDGAPNNTLTLLKDYEPRFIPGGIKPLLWESSCIWAQRCDRNEYHFPAFQTIYDDDTSIANSLYVIMALSAINKVADRVNRRFLGKSSLPDAVFKANVEKELNSELEGMFGTVFNPTAECIITDLDKRKGFVWRTNVTLRGANMKTVCLHSITLRRMDEE